MEQPDGNALDDLGPVGDAIRKIREGLRPGGPPVDEAALHAYVADVIVEEEKLLIAQNIATWQNWFEAYWEIRAIAGSDDVGLASDPSQVWLGVPITREALQSKTAVLRATSLSLLLCKHSSLKPAVGARSLSEPAANLVTFDLLEKKINDQKVLAFQAVGCQWLQIGLDGDDIVVRAGESPARPFLNFFMEFRHRGELVYAIASEEGAIRLAPIVFQKASEKSADQLIIMHDTLSHDTAE